MAACASTQEDEDSLVQCVEILIRNGAKVNAAERHRVTPLMFASKEKRLKLVKTLLVNGADANAQDNRGWTVEFRHNSIERDILLIFYSMTFANDSEKGSDVGC